jgi:hypothetical protein
MHYRGHSGPDWLYLEKSKFLEKLVKKYFIHLGQESFFDLD